ncbi:hypothetical protein POTOM_005766 [Populus tomentosa]|uniref:K-box domain-containing protein n=1 Tax=Populus tomentosa TaxID=118781 RepID=A0A8X8ASF5_POPTO|nr:hypothetical protein POTOM_005766 [Populus tomentosa]
MKSIIERYSKQKEECQPLLNPASEVKTVAWTCRFVRQSLLQAALINSILLQIIACYMMCFIFCSLVVEKGGSKLEEGTAVLARISSVKQLMGEELSGLSIKNLENLENQLEKSMKGVRIKKEQILTDEIKEMSQKGNLIYQENQELLKKVDLISQENAELRKVYEERNVDEANRASRPPYTVENGYDLHAPIRLQLSQPQPQPQPHNSEAPASSMKLG